MSRVRVVHVIPTLDRSGAEKQLTLLAAGLPRDRFDVSVVALTRGGPYQAELAAAKVPVTIIGKSLKIDPFAALRLERHLRDVKPDLVQTWLFAGNAYGRFAARRAGVRRIIASERCVDSWKRRHELWIDRWLAKRTDRIAVNSAAVADFYRRQGISADKLVVIPNGIEVDPETDRGAARRALRAELGVPPDATVIATIGRLWPQKRTADVIWAADVLRVSGVPTHLAIIGDGPGAESLRRFVRDIELDAWTHFLGHRQDVPNLLPGLDAVVIASLFEGMPNVALEAMAAGVPVVATGIAGMNEVIDDGRTGVLVPPKRPYELAKGLYRILHEDPELGRRMGAEGRKVALERFSIERMVRGYVDLYETLLRS